MVKALLLSVSVVASFMLGYWVRDSTPVVVQKLSSTKNPAYLVAGWNAVAAEKLGPFSEAVVPLAEEAGYELFAIKEPKLLEGIWPYTGVVIVQRYRSMTELEAFWNSAEHNKVKMLRDGYIESHFVIAVEGVDR